MYTFLMIFSLFGIAIAFPQGYNYDQPQQSQQVAAFQQNLIAPAASNPPIHSQPAPIISKNFYIHAAPTEHAEQTKSLIVGQPRKHYQILFIRAPENPTPSIRLSPATNEEKTVVYVLTKKTEDADIQADINHTEPSKPEVFFIKYKTPEEAQLAQSQIQAQYNALGGSSQISDEGIAPITSVIGSVPHAAHGGLGDSHFPSASNSNSIAAVDNSYLPPTH